MIDDIINKISFKGLDKKKRIEDTHLFFIGLGSVGSFLVRDMAEEIRSDKSLNIHLYDGDFVEEKNLINQVYEKKEIGYRKSFAIKERFNLKEALTYPMFNKDNSMSWLFCDGVLIFFICVDGDNRPIVAEGIRELLAERKSKYIIIEQRASNYTMRILTDFDITTYQFNGCQHPSDLNDEGACHIDTNKYLDNLKGMYNYLEKHLKHKTTKETTLISQHCNDDHFFVKPDKNLEGYV